MPKKGVEPAGLRRWRLAHRRKGKSHRSARSSGGSGSYGFGQAYLDGKLTAQVAAPAIDLATHLQGVGAQQAYEDLKFHVLSKEYAEGAASAIVQRWADKKVGQAAALSRGSVTAWAAELVPVATTWSEKRGQGLRAIFSGYNARTTGYNPGEQRFDLNQVTPYAAAKYGLGVARKIANRTRLLAPVKKGLAMIGATF